jgi:hypothetical protein
VRADQARPQALSDQFFHKVEDKLVVHGLTNPIAFNREFRRLASIFQGTCVAYDKAYVAQDDDAFSIALWRNLLNQDPKFESCCGVVTSYVFSRV